MKAVLAFFVVLILFYFIGAFIKWELNPSKWTEEARVLSSLMGFTIALGGAAMVKVNDF